MTHLIPLQTASCAQCLRSLKATGVVRAVRLLAGGGALTAALSAQALDVDAGDYTALPSGTNLGLVYYQHTERTALYAGGHRAPGKAGLDSDVAILRGVHFMEIGGFTIDPQFILPFGRLNAQDDLAPVLGKGSGVGDLLVGGTLWTNKPTEKTHLGFSAFVSLPTGGYDRNKMLNLGENRWKLILQTGYIKPLTDSLTLDLVGDVTLHGRNDDFGPSGQRMKQRPLYLAQSWLRYHFSSASDLRLGLAKSYGGRTEIDGADQDDKLSTTRFAIGGSHFLTPTLQLMGTYGRDISVRQGFKEADRFQLRLLKIF